MAMDFLCQEMRMRAERAQSRWVPVAATFLGECVVRASTVDLHQCQEP